MDLFLDRITQHAINYAIRSGIAITAGYAIQHTGQLLNRVEAPEDRHELQDLLERLQAKIRIISPAIDMIDMISARGNTTLESAVELTGNLRRNIQNMTNRLEKTAAGISDAKVDSADRSRFGDQTKVKDIIGRLKRLLVQIEDAVPFLNLAITTSGARIASGMPATISPSRLLQASTFLTEGDSRFVLQPAATQVGPTFTLSLYMLFSGHARMHIDENIRPSTWKEVIHKAIVKLMRVSSDQLGSRETHADKTYSVGIKCAPTVRSEFAYHLLIVEDLDDDRVHTFEDDGPQPGPFHDVEHAGIREVLPIHDISKIFYADTGKILNIGSEEDAQRPILLLKRDVNDSAGTRMMDPTAAVMDGALRNAPSSSVIDHVQCALDAQLLSSPHHQSVAGIGDGVSDGEAWRLPIDLDPEWLALEVFTDLPETEEEDEKAESPMASDKKGTKSNFTNPNPVHLSSARQKNPELEVHAESSQLSRAQNGPVTIATVPQIKTSLSLLEVLLRLASLQQFQQASHLSIEDEFLNFFLSESSTTGAATGDDDERRRLREEARRRVGFDPYDESPVKIRGEGYQKGNGNEKVGLSEATPSTASPLVVSGTSKISPSSGGLARSLFPFEQAGGVAARGAPSVRSELMPEQSSRSSLRRRTSLSPSVAKLHRMTLDGAEAQ